MMLRNLLISLLFAGLASGPARGQDLFHLSFHATARTLDDVGRLQTHHITSRDLIAYCVGPDALTNNSGTNQQFDLVYNATDDTFQVVNVNDGSPVCDVVGFQGGISNVDRGKIDRLTFVFVPSESQAVGSAVFNGKLRSTGKKMSMHGQIQFVLASLTPGSGAGMMFSSGSVGTNSGLAISVGAGSATTSPAQLIALPGSTVPVNPTNATATNAVAATNTIPGLPNPDLANVLNTTNALAGTINASSPISAALPVNTLPPTPALPPVTGTNSSSAGNTNVLIISTNTPGGIGLITTNTPGAINLISTNPPGAVSLVSSNPGLSFTNGVIISGTFATGLRVGTTTSTNAP